MDVDAPTTPEVDVKHVDPDAPGDRTADEQVDMTGLDEAAAKNRHHDGTDGVHGDHDHVSDNRYIVIAAILAVITAAEVVASYVDLGPVFIPLLLFMMAVKFFVVVSYFMHLKFDNNIFKRLFYTGLFLAVFVYVAALLTFQFFES
ncbi:MAG: cytochrome C oxidase subunit IV family protein [Ilumatobacter sp.]|uniref:cytochrome C oxidase subunit IV family protein n=1 Tax=Ilumatobacter sp. TaxID=1967498 RepID=UPI003299E524